MAPGWAVRQWPERFLEVCADLRASGHRGTALRRDCDERQSLIAVGPQYVGGSVADQNDAGSIRNTRLTNSEVLHLPVNDRISERRWLVVWNIEIGAAAREITSSSPLLVVGL